MTLDDDELLLMLDAVKVTRDEIRSRNFGQAGIALYFGKRNEAACDRLIAKLEQEREDRENGDA